VDGECGKLVTIVSHQFITLAVDICVQHCGRETLRHVGEENACIGGYKTWR